MATNGNPKSAVLEDVVILHDTWRNFSGERRKFNTQGSRNFNIKLTKEQYEAMLADEWPVRVRESRDEFDEPLYYMQCKLRYQTDENGNETNRGPKVVVITANGRVEYDNTMVHNLDKANIRVADMALRQSPWNDEREDGKLKYSAYCNELYVTIEESFLTRKYGECEGDACEVGLPGDSPFKAPWE